MTVAQHPSVKPRPGPESAWPECCGMTGVCKVMDESFCMYVNHKRRRDRIWAALPKCSECGGGEQATRHVAKCHPEHHTFASPEEKA